jgi:hypothetical protein
MKKYKFSVEDPLFQHLSIGLIMVMAIVMRFYNFAGWSLSNDELSALNRLQFDSFSEMIDQGVKLNDFHPAGVQAFLWFWTHLFGNSVWVVRLPFVVCGILSVWLTWLIGKRWLGTTTALFAAASMAFLQYPILYSQLARPYAPGLLFSLITVWYWTKIIFDEKKKMVHYAGFAIFSALTAYTHHYSFLFVLIVGLSGFFFIRRGNIRNYLLAALAAVLLYSPHIRIFLHQFGIGGVGGEEGWLGKPESDWIIKYLWHASNESYILALILGIPFLFSVYKLFTKPTKFQIISISWFLLMFLIGYWYSIWRNPILQYSILIFAFPFLLFFTFSAPLNISKRPRFFLILLFLSVGAIQTTTFYRFYEKQHFGEFKGIAEKFASWNDQYGRENVSNAIVVNAPFYIHYYLDEMKPGIEFLQYDNRGREDLKSFSQMLDSVQTPYFIFGWTKPAPLEIELMIASKYPCIADQVEFADLSRVTLFSSEPVDSCISPIQADCFFENNFDDKSAIESSGKNLDSTFSISKPFSLKVDSLMEYAPAFRTSVGDIPCGDFIKIEFSAEIYAEEEIKDAIIVLTLTNNGEEYLWQPSQIQNFAIPGKWKKCFLVHFFKDIKSQDDILNIYIWNRSRSTFYLDDMCLKFFKDHSEANLK